MIGESPFPYFSPRQSMVEGQINEELMMQKISSSPTSGAGAATEQRQPPSSDRSEKSSDTAAQGMEKAIEALDKNKNGKLDEPEIQELLAMLNQGKASEAGSESSGGGGSGAAPSSGGPSAGGGSGNAGALSESDLMQALDTNGDGEISMEELKAALSKKKDEADKPDEKAGPDNNATVDHKSRSEGDGSAQQGQMSTDTAAA